MALCFFCSVDGLLHPSPQKVDPLFNVSCSKSFGVSSSDSKLSVDIALDSWSTSRHIQRSSVATSPFILQKIEPYPQHTWQACPWTFSGLTRVLKSKELCTAVDDLRGGLSCGVCERVLWTIVTTRSFCTFGKTAVDVGQPEVGGLARGTCSSRGRRRHGRRSTTDFQIIRLSVSVCQAGDHHVKSTVDAHGSTRCAKNNPRENTQTKRAHSTTVASNARRACPARSVASLMPFKSWACLSMTDWSRARMAGLQRSGQESWRLSPT